MKSNNNSPIVSIICITYNHENFISQALDGFLMQKTTFPFEIIVHDDASTDNTTSIVKDYESKHTSLFANIYQTENQYSKVEGDIAKIVFSAARGKYIALCEGDDYWTDPLKLQKQVDFLEANEDFAICHHKMQIIYENEPEKNKLSNENQKEVTDIYDLAKGNYIYTASCVFRRKNYELPDWFNKCLVGDYPLHLLNARFGKIKFINEVMGVYRIHKNGIWETKTTEYKLVQWLRLLIILKDKLDIGINKILEEQCCIIYLRLLLKTKGSTKITNFSSIEETIRIDTFLKSQRNKIDRKSLLDAWILQSNFSVKNLFRRDFVKIYWISFHLHPYLLLYIFSTIFRQKIIKSYPEIKYDNPLINSIKYILKKKLSTYK